MYQYLGLKIPLLNFELVVDVLLKAQGIQID
jgi:hypothetical protein